MGQAEQYDVFLSYRRAGGIKDAMLIKLALENHGYHVFLDLSDLGAGEFGWQLFQRIDECRGFVLIVSPHALERCENEQDWLRLELEHAHDKGKNIVPVLMDVDNLPENLPKSISFIKKLQRLRFNFYNLDHFDQFEAFIGRLLKYLQSEPVLPPPPSVPVRQSATPLSPPAPSKPTQSRKPAFVAGRDNVLMEDVNDGTFIEECASARVFSTKLERRQIKTITFLDSLADAPKSAKDFSQNKDQSVLGWTRKSSDELYDLYIAGEGGVSAPKKCTGLFNGYINVIGIYFNEAFHTDCATSFWDTFRYCEKLTTLDLSSFHTGNVTDMYGMFYKCARLTHLDISGFDTSKVTDMRRMFDGCDSLSSLNLSNFDFSHVRSCYGFMPDSLDPNWERYFTRK